METECPLTHLLYSTIENFLASLDYNFKTIGSDDLKLGRETNFVIVSLDLCTFFSLILVGVELRLCIAVKVATLS